mmetsp:Transcript_17676/g.29873  ORF Transcript_17676/g.29873 Transcript_17676/m.29873 type:complete len:136 (+) Transcript_17676:99-506(+)
MGALGNYDASIEKFKFIFQVIARYARKLEGGGAETPNHAGSQGKSKLPGFASQTASSQQKIRGAGPGGQGEVAASQSTIEKWQQFKVDLKGEYDIVVEMHQQLLQLDDDPDLIQNGMMGLFDEYYQVEGFESAVK